jgi:cyclic pyranopterin phosphate synthase
MTGLTHLDSDGNARMVDVADREVVVRSATAAGRVITTTAVLEAIKGGTTPKGDVAAVARIAGIMGAKRTPDLIPLCHPIALHGVDVDVAVTDEAIELTATTRTADRTGVEMEALTAIAVAGLAVIDMIKALDPSAHLTDVRVLSKHGGRHGDWERPSP